MASAVTSTEATPTPELIVHHLNNSRSQRILWLLEELEISYAIKKYQRMPDMLAPPELKEVNPLGNAPVITEGSLNLAESGAIVVEKSVLLFIPDYVITKYGGGRAQPPQEGLLDNIYWTHYAEASLMPMLVNKMIFEIIPQRSPFFLRPLIKGIFKVISNQMLDPRLKIHASEIEKHLSKINGWFAGGQEPTSADYMMIFALETWATAPDNPLGPKTIDYVERVHARPAYERALEKGGQYDYAKVKTKTTV